MFIDCMLLKPTLQHMWTIVGILPSRDAVKDVMFQVLGLVLKAFTKGRSFLGLSKP